MATKKPKKESALVIATQLAEVRERMAYDAGLNKALTAALKEALGKEGKKEAGNYHLVKSSKFEVIAEELALPFALERGATKIDTSKIKKIFQLDTNLRFEDPNKFGFEVVTSEKIAPIGSKEVEE